MTFRAVIVTTRFAGKFDDCVEKGSMLEFIFPLWVNTTNNCYHFFSSEFAIVYRYLIFIIEEFLSSNKNKIERFQNVLIFMPLHPYTWLLGATPAKVTHTHSLWQIKYQHTLRTGHKWVCKLTAAPNEQRLVGSRRWWLIRSGSWEVVVGGSLQSKIV